MKRALGIDYSGSWTFTPGAANAGTIAFSGVTLPLKSILLVTNVTRGVVIFQFNSATRGAASYSNGVLTLEADTSTHSASDELHIRVDVDAKTDVSTGELIEAVEAMRQAINSLTRTVGQIRTDIVGRAVTLIEQPTAANCQVTATISGTPNVAVSSGTLTNATQLGGIAANDLIPIASRLGGDNLRRNISVT